MQNNQNHLRFSSLKLTAFLRAVKGIKAPYSMRVNKTIEYSVTAIGAANSDDLLGLFAMFCQKHCW